MTRAAWALLLLTCCRAPVGTQRPVFGIVSDDCLASPAPDLRPGDRIGPAVVVSKRTEPCKGSSAQPSLHHYEVRTVEASPNMTPVAVSNMSAQQRMCASSEGLHFTAWSSKPLESKRLWHQYFYLGYDVDSNCTPTDTAPD